MSIAPSSKFGKLTTTYHRVQVDLFATVFARLQPDWTGLFINQGLATTEQGKSKSVWDCSCASSYHACNGIWLVSSFWLLVTFFARFYIVKKQSIRIKSLKSTISVLIIYDQVWWIGLTSNHWTWPSQPSELYGGAVNPGGTGSHVSRASLKYVVWVSASVDSAFFIGGPK